LLAAYDSILAEEGQKADLKRFWQMRPTYGNIGPIFEKRNKSSIPENKRIRRSDIGDHEI